MTAVAYHVGENIVTITRIFADQGELDNNELHSLSSLVHFKIASMLMRSLYLLGFFLLLLFSVGSSAQAQEPPQSVDLIRLQAATFAPLPITDPIIAANVPTSPYYLVQFNGPVEALWVQQITALGGQVLGYIPDNTHIVRLAPAAVPNVRSLPGVRWVGPY